MDLKTVTKGGHLYVEFTDDNIKELQSGLLREEHALQLFADLHFKLDKFAKETNQFIISESMKTPKPKIILPLKWKVIIVLSPILFIIDIIYHIIT